MPLKSFAEQEKIPSESKLTKLPSLQETMGTTPSFICHVNFTN